MSFTVREFTHEDIPLIAELESQLFPSDAWPLAMFYAEYFQPDTRRYLAALAGGQIVGYCGLMCLGQTADIQTIAVVPAWEGRGIGRELMRLMLQDARSRGAREVLLEVRADNPRAQELYERAGFSRIHVRKKYYRDGVDAWVMRLEFPPVVNASGSDEHGPLVLGIESSCDETGVGIVAGTRLLANAVSSSMDEHVRFGGVIPEIASRAHLDALVPTLRQALAEAKVTLDEIDAIAVTAGPGLSGALMVGVSAAKALALATGKPLYAVNHLVAHVGVGMLGGTFSSGLPGNLGALLVSGGHTEILRVGNIVSDVELLGATIDDAAGEAYDKVARLLGLGYPGGPAIDRVAAQGDPRAIRFPRGLTQPKYMGTAETPGPHRYDWSFSGLKTAVARSVEQFAARGEQLPVADIAASFQEAVVDVITAKAVLACTEHGITELLLGGGVAANSRLRALTAERCAVAGIGLTVPQASLCTDNGAMVAALGARIVMAGGAPSDLGFGTDSSLPVRMVSL